MFLDTTHIPQKYNKEDWSKSNIQLTDEHLFINGELIMNKDETPIMHKLGKLIGEHGGDVLETGYGMGISTKIIDCYPNVKTHTIIEANENVYQVLLKYSKESKVDIIPQCAYFEDWIKTVPDNTYDAVFYDTFPLEDEDKYINGAIYTRKVYEDIYRVLKPGGLFSYFGNWFIREEDKQFLIKSGFKEDNIYFEKLVTKVYEHSCSYPHSELKEEEFLIPKIYK